MRRTVLLPLLAGLAAALAPAPAAGQASLSAEQLQKIKAATVFIKVRVPGGAATGSGFVVKVDGDTGYVVTNDHVIAVPDGGDAADGMGRPTIEVVFDSGGPKERTVKAEVAATDPGVDLAVLKVTAKDLPAPLSITDPPALMETMQVFACGFPLGERLAVGNRNPEISINRGSVSAIRRDALGRVAQIQLEVTLLPGNSGGPVVDPAGKLVGVAVKTVRGASVGMAIPQQEVTAMLRGRPGAARLVPAGEGAARLEVAVIDPLRTVKSVAAHYKPADGPPPPASPDKPAVMPGATKVPLTIERGVASAEVKLPAGKKPELIVQVEMEVAEGTVLTAPGPVALSAPADRSPGALGRGPRIQLPSGLVLPLPTFRRPPGAEDETLGDLIRKPEAFLGKAVEFEALSNGTVLPQGDKYELVIETDAEKAPTNLRPVVPKDLALQLSDLGIGDPWKFAVRVKGRVEKPAGRDDRHLIEVSEVGFLDEAGKVAATLKPESAPPAGKPSLSALNRFPEKYAGQVVTVDGFVKGAKFAGAGHGVEVANENGATPLNLDFYAAKELHNQLAAEVPNTGAAAKLTVAVERVDAKTGRGVVGVSKVELFGVGAKPKTLASTDKISYPPASAAAPAAKPKSPAGEKAAAGTPGPAAKVPGPGGPAPAAGGGSTLTYVLIGAGVLVVVLGGAGLAFLRLRKGAAPPPRRYGAATPPAADAEPAPRPRAAKPAARPAPRATNGPPQDEFPGFDFEKRG